MPPGSTTKTEALLKLARRGPLRSSDLDRIGAPRAYLSRLVAKGVLEKVERGLYRLSNSPVTEHHSLAEVAKRAPHATICLLSALQYHGLTTEAPHAVWILIDRHARMPRMSALRINVVRASGDAKTHGIDHNTIEGVDVQITTPAKTVADCFRYRRHVGLEVAVEALRDYTRKYRHAIPALIAAAKADRIYIFMRPYIEAMV